MVTATDQYKKNDNDDDGRTKQEKSSSKQCQQQEKIMMSTSTRNKNKKKNDEETTIFFTSSSHQYENAVDDPDDLINPFTPPSSKKLLRRQRTAQERAEHAISPHNRRKSLSSSRILPKLPNASPIFRIPNKNSSFSMIHNNQERSLESSSSKSTDNSLSTVKTSSSSFTSKNHHQQKKHQQQHNIMNNNNINLENCLEMEEATPPRPRTIPRNDDNDLLGIGLEPLTTTSGLILTHRKVPPSKQQQQQQQQRRPTKNNIRYGLEIPMRSNYFGGGDDSSSNRGQLVDFGRWTKLWLVSFCVMLLLGTATIWHLSHHEVNTATTTSRKQVVSTNNNNNNVTSVDKIILRPFPANWSSTSGISSSERSSRRLSFAQLPRLEKKENHHLLHELRLEFDNWMQSHGKKYHSHHEKEKRFHIFKENHHRTVAKNERHGPCRMTKKQVFGHNMFSDLTQEEFQQQFLTGYKGPKTDELHEQMQQNRRRHQRRTASSQKWGHVLNPNEKVKLHPKVQSNLDDHNRRRGTRKLSQSAKASYSGSCTWYDVSCWLRYFVNTYGYGWGGTMEPTNGNGYPGEVDWRNYGVVTDVKSQGNCGGCWAITAVETIESAYAISSGSLMTLAETEVILCDDTCDMCEGGWPQNAYEYVAQHGGLPPLQYMSYDGDFLLGLTYSKNAENGYDTSSYQSYFSLMCPGGGGGGGSNSGSNDNYNDNSNYNGNSLPRYGKPKGYGYATDRCVCYTDGSGCDCDEQDEKLALQNLASYGPAVVCLEASMWQDYDGGIMTSEIGCSSGFMDMNHCVQTVGFAFTSDGDDEENEGGDNSGSGSGSQSGSGDQLNGYWIIRNQWSENWGMNGYAYLAMGENTCGVLNDMTIVYM